VWQDLLAAVALVLVLEGIVPFANPAAFRRTLLTAARLDDKILRTLGLLCMIGGLVMLYAVR
jgi:uncharacterized protein